MSEPLPRGTTLFAYATGAVGLSIWFCMLWLGPHEAALRLIEAPLLTDYDVYRDQLLRVGMNETISSRWYYPPFAAVLLWPLRAPEPLALTGFCLMQLALLVGLCRESFALLERLPHAPRTAAAVGLSLVCYPVSSCLAWGQVGLLVTWLTLRSLSGSGRSLGWLGAAAAFKLYPLFYALGQLVRLDLRGLARLGAWLMALGALVPLIWLGPAISAQFFEVALSVGLRATGPRFDMDQTLEAWLTRLFYARSLFDATPHGELLNLPLPLVMTLSLLGSAAVLAYALWRTRALAVNDPLAVAALLAVGALLIKPGWPHYYVVLPFVQAALLAGARRSRDLGLCGLSIAAGALPFVSLVFPYSLVQLEQWGVLTLSTLIALIGVCELAARRSCERRSMSVASGENVTSG
jgi:Glycosyltransferase family 87